MGEEKLTKVGGYAAVVGGILAIIGNLMHPRPDDYGPGMTERMLANVSESNSWLMIHFLIAISIALLVIGLVAAIHTMRGTAGEHWARLAFAFGVGGGALAISSVLIDGYATKVVAESWAQASSDSQPAALLAAQAIEGVSWGLFMSWIIVFLTGATALFALSVIAGGVYPKWIGWLGIISAAGSAASSWIGLFSGVTAQFFMVFTGASLLGTFLFFAVGVMMLRKAPVRASV